METRATENLYLEVPKSEVRFLRSLSRKMGWSIKKPRKSGIQQALDDVKAGRVYEAKSIEDLMAQLDE
ncbi:MAG: hypothetical protein IKH59_08040 [Bacteroidaceae bacterium]|nr:hypothetical protein [Bacteroidaceae bacterium]